MSFDKTELSQRWAALSVHARLLSIVGLLAILTAMAYTLIYLPLQAENQRLRQQIQAQQDLNQHLQAVARRVNALKAQNIVSADTQIDLVRVIADSSQQMALDSGLQFQSDADGNIVIKVSQLAFDRLVYWLAVLQQQHGLSISALTLHRSAQDTALVDGELVIRGNK